MRRGSQGKPCRYGVDFRTPLWVVATFRRTLFLPPKGGAYIGRKKKTATPNTRHPNTQQPNLDEHRSSGNYLGSRCFAFRSFSAVRKGLRANARTPLSFADRILEQGVVSRLSPKPHATKRPPGPNISHGLAYAPGGGAGRRRSSMMRVRVISGLRSTAGARKGTIIELRFARMQD